jgi:hypothetical protein
MFCIDVSGSPYGSKEIFEFPEDISVHCSSGGRLALLKIIFNILEIYLLYYTI